ncbi:hypothetical protein [Providencia rettgeri]|uniref:hypothetical protein n=1 Tax=Providencia rettgeri TaxID=587 RepID=UPI0018E435DF|nr:hypothetical protein [Providencia rettgeri]MBI6192216.1 hypothetical protein [Providencia rettgeri]
MNFLVLLISLSVACISGYFVYKDPDLTSISTFLTGLGALLGSIISISKKQKPKKMKGAISQHVGDNSTAIQVGGDIHINKGTEK